MAVDLNTLIPYLRAEANLADDERTSAQLLLSLRNAFWQARLDGVAGLAGYSENNGVISNNTSGGPDLSRELQQVVVLFAGISELTNFLRNVNTVFRTKAGETEFETQQSAQVLREIITLAKERRKTVMQRLTAILNPAQILNLEERWNVLPGEWTERLSILPGNGV